MCAKDFRQQARQKLSGKWEAVILITLVYTILIGALSATVVGACFVGGALVLGWNICCLQIAQGKKITLHNLFDGFKDFTRALLIFIITGLTTFYGLYC